MKTSFVLLLLLSVIACQHKQQVPNHQVTVSWKAVEGAKGYKVYRSDNADSKLICLTGDPVTATSYVDKNVEPGKTYTYQVTAIDQTKTRTESDFSTQITATVPNP